MVSSIGTGYAVKFTHSMKILGESVSEGIRFLGRVVDSSVEVLRHFPEKFCHPKREDAASRSRAETQESVIREFGKRVGHFASTLFSRGASPAPMAPPSADSVANKAKAIVDDSQFVSTNILFGPRSDQDAKAHAEASEEGLFQIGREAVQRSLRSLSSNSSLTGFFRENQPELKAASEHFRDIIKNGRNAFSEAIKGVNFDDFHTAQEMRQADDTARAGMAAKNSEAFKGLMEAIFPTKSGGRDIGIFPDDLIRFTAAQFDEIDHQSRQNPEVIRTLDGWVVQQNARPRSVAATREEAVGALKHTVVVNHLFLKVLAPLMAVDHQGAVPSQLLMSTARRVGDDASHGEEKAGTVSSNPATSVGNRGEAEVAPEANPPQTVAVAPQKVAGSDEAVTVLRSVVDAIKTRVSEVLQTQSSGPPSLLRPSMEVRQGMFPPISLEAARLRLAGGAV